MSLEICITITDQESIDDIKAVGTRDLKEYFLPKAGIKADRVSIYTVNSDASGNNQQGE